MKKEKMTDFWAFGGYSKKQLESLLTFMKGLINFKYEITSETVSQANAKELCFWVDITVNKEDYDKLLQLATLFAEKSELFKN